MAFLKTDAALCALRRSLTLAGVAILGMTTSACFTPGSGPTSASILNASNDRRSPPGFQLVEMTSATLAPYRLVRRDLNGPSAARGDGGRVSLSTGDVLRVTISESREGGMFAPLASGGNSFPNVRVDDRGTIQLPYAGAVPVRGADAAQVGERIKRKLADQGVFEPQVYVELQSDHAGSVLVSGEVKAPGRVSMLDGGASVLDAIAKAGGATKAPHQQAVILRRGQSSKKLSMMDVLAGRNLRLQRGDQIVVVDELKTFTAAGAVMRPGQIEFNKPQLSLSDALALSGGLKDGAANPTGVFVFRLARVRGANRIFRFDMARPETLFLAQAFEVAPDDTIFVTNAPSYEWEKLILPVALTLSAVRSGVALSGAIERN